MRNLSRALALAAALILTGLTAQVSADILGTCYVRCQGTTRSSYTTPTTYADCCTWDVPNSLCPAGTTAIPMSWNYMRCEF